MRLIHIAPINLIPFVDKHYNKGYNMALTHLVLDNPEYREAIGKLKGTKYLDNSFYELGECLSPAQMVKAAKMIGATHLICPDGSYKGAAKFVREGYKVMTIPKTPKQFQKMMQDPDIDLVAVSEEHFDYRHSPGARYELFRDYLTDDMPKKKIHLLGATDSLWELGMLSPFDDWIESWDSSAAIWQGHLGHSIRTRQRKDTTSVDFDTEATWNLMMENNIQFLEGITK